ncbi:hypothetical protein [Cucumibacter marinus]|uniref:hypothetical protein n=1 Tax=Cucumibacter marinus TaxID=1121252 RepID=UPI0004250946|nr:hypothetical protein [Cucumibacter marinus]
MQPTYTFMSRSTAKPGRFDDLVRIASAPPAAIDRDTDGVVAYQVSADRERNSVVVWITMTEKKTMDDYLASPKGAAEHGDADEMEAIIETFEMFDLTPVAGRLAG